MHNIDLLKFLKGLINATVVHYR